jgi:putative ABC transport system ATP-binding protein
MELIRELNAAGATILMITHEAGLANQLPRQIRVLDGQVVSDIAGDRSAPATPVHVATEGRTS